MSGGKRIAVSVAAGLALPAYILTLYELPIGALHCVVAIIFAVNVVTVAVGTYKMLRG